MNLELSKKPREFKVGQNQSITIKDMGNIYLEPNEQITLVTPEKQEYDVCRKEWGYYATPSFNDRLKRFGFKTALVKNAKGQGFIMLVESQKIDSFLNYLSTEENDLVCWLDDGFSTEIQHNNQNTYLICPICKSSGIEIIKEFDTRPAGENDFNINPYQRNLCRCMSCDHYFNKHQYDFKSLYSTDYCESVYQNTINETFKKIISLPNEKSDNYHRVKRVISLVENIFFTNEKNINVLDIGSGLCVFLYALKNATEWNCIALDPDPRQAKHANEVCGIPCVNESIFSYQPDRNFNLVTLNKVLEHFENPLDILKKIKTFFKEDQSGYLYLEIPDGEMAILESPSREEFFIEHYHAFSYQSLQLILKQSGWHILTQVRLREPSGKYTIYCLAKSHRR